MGKKSLLWERQVVLLFHLHQYNAAASFDSFDAAPSNLHWCK